VGSENVEIVRRLYEMFRTRDNEAAFELMDPEIEWDTRGAGIPGADQVYAGHEGVKTYWRAWLEAWDEIDFDVDEPVELEENRVVARITRQRNHGRGTGIWIDQRPYVQEWTLRDGKVVRMRMRWLDPD
jgi:ketosteroid isomerase-like protein